MHNDIAMYRNSWSGYDFPPSLLPMFLSGIGAIAAFVGMIPPFTGMWTIYLMSISFTVMLVNFILYKTNIHRRFSKYQVYAWNAYQALPRECRSKVSLTIDILDKMGNREAEALGKSFDEVRKNHEALLNERRRYSGPTYELKKRVESMVEDSKIELETTREVNKEMQSLL